MQIVLSSRREQLIQGALTLTLMQGATYAEAKEQDLAADCCACSNGQSEKVLCWPGTDEIVLKGEGPRSREETGSSTATAQVAALVALKRLVDVHS